eukprot:1313851-Lingulodinium_polyedra.AAC.1
MLRRSINKTINQEINSSTNQPITHSGVCEGPRDQVCALYGHRPGVFNKTTGVARRCNTVQQCYRQRYVDFNAMLELDSASIVE